MSIVAQLQLQYYSTTCQKVVVTEKFDLCLLKQTGVTSNPGSAHYFNFEYNFNSAFSKI